MACAQTLRCPLFWGCRMVSKYHLHYNASADAQARKAEGLNSAGAINAPAVKA